jgi:hypothetical protein
LTENAREKMGFLTGVEHLKGEEGKERFRLSPVPAIIRGKYRKEFRDGPGI